MKVLLREPLAHFMLAGLLLFVAHEALAPVIGVRDESAAIRVSRADLDRLRERWRNETGRAPDAAERRALVRSHVDERLLFREALRLGLHRGDPVVRRRLIRNMRFADPDTEFGNDALAARARALGMVERDPVIRRRLIQVMRHRIQSRARVSRARVQARIEADHGKRALAARYDFRQVFFSGDRRAEPRQAASDALARLRAADGEEPETLGDPFQSGRRYRGLGAADIERRFGARLAARVERAPVGRWVGPVASVYGAHLIRVVSTTPARPAEPARLRPRAVAEVYAERERARMRAALQRLRTRYRVRIPDRPAAWDPGT